MRARIYVTRRLPECVMQQLEKIYEVKCNPYDRNMDQEELKEAIRKCDVIITMLADRIGRDIIELNPDLKGICNYAVGYNNIDVQAATESGIPVCNTPGVLTETTADLTWALIFAAARRIVEADRYTRAGKFTGWAPMLMQGQDIYGKTLGIIGAGRIGEAVARRSMGFGMKVIYHNHHENKWMNEHLQAEHKTLEEVLKESDIISMHIPYNQETHHLVDTEQFRMMKPTAVLINTARGKVINEQELINALQRKQIAAAGLDVYYNEPEVPEEMIALDNVVIVPHIGSASCETRVRMAELVRDCAAACLAGVMPPAIVNPQVIKGMR
ncbi:MAG: D-glycerate dehydrogenase [Candidatus Stygibacter frigidus]|nr:D-glycerate dehydrogenase [Candidatus Stygibacter frigidus]